MFWDIAIKKHLKGMEYQEWGYVIDATNGTLMGAGVRMAMPPKFLILK
ncbi:MAG: hypothetical protein ACYC6W_02885 [Nitrosotalea sp.]